MRVLTLLWALLLTDQAQAAPLCTGGAVPCDIDIATAKVTEAPLLFRFQGKVAQAGTGLGDRELAVVAARILAGTRVVCQEEFTNVRLQRSVLTLELGRGMDCELPRVLAREGALALQICLGGTDSCLKPVALATVPYAIRSRVALQVRHADSAKVSMLSHYARRASADRHVLTSDEISTGTFDFSHTEYAPGAIDGYIQWAPLSVDAPARLHVCAQDWLSEVPRRLDRLSFFAANSAFAGDLHVEADEHVRGAITVEGSEMLAGKALAAHGNAFVGAALAVASHTTVDGALSVQGGSGHEVGGATLSVESSGISARGDGALPEWQLLATPDRVSLRGLTNRGIDRDGDGRLDPGPHLVAESGALLEGSIRLGQGLGRSEEVIVDAPATFRERATMQGRLQALAPVALTHHVTFGQDASDQLVVLAPSTFASDTITQAPLTVADATVAGSVTSNQQISSLRVLGAATFMGAARFERPVTFAASAPARFAGPVTFSLPVTLPQGVSFGAMSIGHHHLNVAGAECDAGLVASYSNDLSAVCSTTRALAGTYPYIYLKDEAGTPGLWVDNWNSRARVVAAEGRSLEVWGHGVRRLVLEGATVSIEDDLATASLRVDGDVIGIDDVCSTRSGAEIVAAPGSATVNLDCSPGEVPMGAAVRWDLRVGNICYAVPATAGEDGRHDNCYVDPNNALRVVCIGTVTSASVAACMRAQARCCRVR
jgi:hypothetical protein